MESHSTRNSGATATTDRRSGNGTAGKDRAFLEKFGDKLSKSTQRAKWIGETSQHADHRGQTLATRDHEVIKAWAKDRGATPATVEGTRHDGQPGVLRFDFPDYGGRNLEHIEWQEWLDTFDRRDLVFLYQERMKNGSDSNFFRLDSPHREDG